MATRLKKTSPAKTTAVAKSPEAEKRDKAKVLAKIALRPSVNAAVVVREYSEAYGQLDLTALADSLREGSEAVNQGDMHRAEAMLYTQANALQAMFTSLARRALKQEYQKNLESFLRMALKAQNQCRMTLETLATVKNPPVVFARQANINNGGQQQVNNGAPADPANYVQAHTGSHAANSKTDRPELLEEAHGQRLDTRAPRAASSTDPQLAPVGKIHRPAN